MPVKDSVVERFKQICKEKNIRINELANLSGVTPSTAYSIFDPKRRDVSLITIKKYCDGLAYILGVILGVFLRFKPRLTDRVIPFILWQPLSVSVGSG